MRVIPPWAKIVAVLLVFAFVFGAGWKVSEWRSGSKQAAAADARAARLIDGMEASRADLKERVAQLDAFNEATALAQQTALDEIRQARRDLQGVRDEISSVDVGGAAVTADGDRLRNEAYRAATRTARP